MAKAIGRTRCATCDKEKATLKCGGCAQDFCFDHVTDHRQELSKKLDEIEVNRDLFRQTLTEQTVDLQEHLLIQEINQWEHDSINKIRRTAEEARQILLQHTDKHIKQVEMKLSKLTEELRQQRDENDFFETDLSRWSEELIQLSAELNKLSDISLRSSSTPFITKISVDVSDALLYFQDIDANARWIQNGITVAGNNQKGNGVDQLAKPYGIYVDDDQTIYIADYENNRIVEWKHSVTRGQVVAAGHERRERTDQLYHPTNVVLDKHNDCLIVCDTSNQRVMRWPRQNNINEETIISDINCYGLAIDSDGYLYIGDYARNEVRRYCIGDTIGTIVAGGNGRGNRADQLNNPGQIFVDKHHSVYVSDLLNHRVMKWMKDAREGIVVAGGQGQGNSLAQLSSPNGIIVDDLGTIYVADSKNSRVMSWPKGAVEGHIVVGGNGSGNQPNQLNYPIGLSFDQYGNLYVCDAYNHRVQKFNINSDENL